MVKESLKYGKTLLAPGIYGNVRLLRIIGTGTVLERSYGAVIWGLSISMVLLAGHAGTSAARW